LRLCRAVTLLFEKVPFMSQSLTRREMILAAAAVVVGGAVAPRLLAIQPEKPLYQISCTEYSLHKTIAAGELDHQDYAPFIRKTFDMDAVEYWSGPWAARVTDKEYVLETRKKADDADVKGLVILVDGEGHLGDPDEARRRQAVENHFKWLDAAKVLGCHSIRVNAHATGTWEEQMERAADGLRQLCEKAKESELSVIVENHGGLSSNGEWLAGVMKAVDMGNCGTFPDFGNFYDYDRYEGTKELMPWAKAVSAKSHEFDEQGNETEIDYKKMMKIVVDAGYDGYVGIEYEGNNHSEVEGVRLTKELLERVRGEMR
jgi:sugar phosphate isomerase/epimerase